MKRYIGWTISLALITTALHAEGFDEFKLNADAIYREGTGAHESAATALGASMFAWGIGLAIGIAILCAAVHQSRAHH